MHTRVVYATLSTLEHTGLPPEAVRSQLQEVAQAVRACDSWHHALLCANLQSM